jgi:hypothetical protein
MKPTPRFTPDASPDAREVHGAHDPYLPPAQRKHGWSRLPNRVHLGRGFRLRGRITGTHRHHAG